MRDIFRRWLGIEELEGRVDDLELQIGSALKHFGNYKNRTAAELQLIRSQLDDLLHAVTNALETIENDAKRQRAASLKRRLLNNLTRVKKALAA
jgi:hypothetical protein